MEDIDDVINIVNKHAEEVRRQKEEQERLRKKHQNYGDLALTSAHISTSATHSQPKSEQHNKKTFSKTTACAVFLTFAATIILLTSIARTDIDELDNTKELSAPSPHTTEYTYEQNSEGPASTNINVYTIPEELTFEYDESSNEAHSNQDLPSEYINCKHDTLNSGELYTQFQQFKEKSNTLYGDSAEEKLWNLFYYQLGCSAEQSAAIMGNISREDPSYNPFQVQVGGGGGIGLFQFSNERNRQLLEFVKNSEEYCSLYSNFTDHAHNSNNNYTMPETLDEDTLDLGIICNIDYLLNYEQKNVEDSGYNQRQLNRAFAYNSLDQMTVGFMSEVEKTHNGEQERLENAHRIFETYAITTTH